MASPQLIRAQRREDLAAFEEALQRFESVGEEDFETLRIAASSVAGAAAPIPRDDDHIGTAAYSAAAFRLLSEAVLAQQERLSELEAQLASRGSAKSTTKR